MRNYIQSNRAPLGIGLTDLFTDYFWNEVEGVTMGILDLLIPLINLLGRDMPDSPWPPLRQVHQRLHDIVAEAAYFTNGMRATRSVFWIQFPLPGELNEISHEHAIDDIWNRSKQKALNHDRTESARWEATRDAALAQRYGDQAITPANRAEYEAENPRPIVRRTAKVQIAMWPFVKRYTPMRERDAGDGAYNTGETITQIMKAQTVYYYGDDSDSVDLKERLTLSEQIKSRRWAKWFTTRAIFCYVLVFVLIFLFTRPPPFPQDLGPNGDIRSSSYDQEFVQRGETTTVEVAPVETTPATETVVVEIDDEDRISKSRQRSKALSVSGTTTKTITETLTKILGGGQGDPSSDADDHEKDYVSDSSGSGSSYGEISGTNDDDSSTGTEDGIAASISPRVERVTETTKSGSNRLTDNVASVAGNIASGAKSARASIASAKEKAAASMTSVKDEAASGIASRADQAGSGIGSVTEKIAESFTSGADQAGSTIESVTEEVAESFTSAADVAGASVASGVGRVSENIASEMDEGDDTYGDDDTYGGDDTADVESGEDEAEENTLTREEREDVWSARGTMEESEVPVKASAEEDKAEATKPPQDKWASRWSFRDAMQASQRASVVAAGSSKQTADGDGITAERTATKTSSTSKKHAATSIKSSTSEGKTRKKASEASKGRDTYEKSTAASVESRADPEEMNIETATIYKNEDGTISSLGVTTKRVATPSKKKTQTTTVTVPPDYVVKVVTGPPASTVGSSMNTYQTGTRSLMC